MGCFKSGNRLAKLKQVLKKRQHVNKKNTNTNIFKYKNFTFLKDKNLRYTYNKNKTTKPLHTLLLQYSVLLLPLISTPLLITYLILNTHLYSQIEYELLIINFLSNSSFENFCIDLSIIW